MKIRAAGIVWSLVLALAPALIEWLPEAADARWVTPTAMAIVVVVLNALIKWAQIGMGEEEPTVLSRSIAPQHSRVHQLFFG